jgi:hypothetical protein
MPVTISYGLIEIHFYVAVLDSHTWQNSFICCVYVVYTLLN